MRSSEILTQTHRAMITGYIFSASFLIHCIVAAIFVILAGCTEIDLVTVTIDDPITESGNYQTDVIITLKDGTVLEASQTVQVTIKTPASDPAIQETSIETIDNSMVVITRGGSKYHPLTSRYAKSETAQIVSVEEAETLGYEPSAAYLRLVGNLDAE